MRSALVAILATSLACGMSAATNAGSGNLEGDAGTGALLWYVTCGDPVCMAGGHRDHGLPRCTGESPGKQCATPGAKCDPGNDCNEDLVCSTTDPRQQSGGCPISRASYKKDIHYLSSSELQTYSDQLLALPLATYRYRNADSRQHLGFLIDGHESLVCVEPERDRVDLYSYASMAVAALQVQARQIDDLTKEVAALRAELEAGRAAVARRRGR
ncbi:MAG: hypothetical protein ACJ79M_21750 [Myxococcales bacterium]